MDTVIEKPLIFTNKSGQKLWGALALPTGKGRAPGLIMCHDFGKAHTERKFADIARALVKNHIASFRFDFAGCGDSEGEVGDTSITRQIWDIPSAFAALARQRSVQKNKIGLLGHGLGALAAVAFQARFNQAKALILVSPALHQSELMERWYSPKQRELWEKQGFLDTPKGRLGNDYLKEARAKDWSELAREIKIPTLVIQSEEDDDVPMKYAEEVVRKLNGPKRLVVIQNADHDFEKHTAKERLIAVCSHWLSKNL